MIFTDRAYIVTPSPSYSGVAGASAAVATILRRNISDDQVTGALEHMLNVRTFMTAWQQVREAGKYAHQDYTVKADPDTVFVPARLGPTLASMPESYAQHAVYVQNCKTSFHFFGALEILSRAAVTVYALGAAKCKERVSWSRMGEDLFMKICLDFLRVPPVAYRWILKDGYCDSAPISCASGVAFHPFKLPDGFAQCFREATR
mmetsp:Transcript_110071/g.318212  ORF Transcript_110071/g.318212 Transcript_110071/m.318212 type:complete len:204 (+) Transcript_110071:610-1221(+)